MTTERGGRSTLMEIDRPDERRAGEATRRSRGPLRPDLLLSVRERHSRRLGVYAFRAFDLIFVLGVTAVALNAVSGPLADTTLAQATPFAVGAGVLSKLLRSLGAYRLGRSERLVPHLGRILFASALALVAALGIDSLIGAGGSSVAVLVVWAALAHVGLGALHVTWWLFVRRWRAYGWLTPNIVIVGATSHAEDLIRHAIKRRDINVLGIFDDRCERSPLALFGVPVLGDTDALIGHRVTPFVDLIVVAVDPKAATRVRQITSRLAVLPNQVTMIVDHHDVTVRTAAIARLADAPLALLDASADEGRRAFAKRVQDLAIGLPMLVLTSPLMALIALAVRLDSRGPVLFRQRRHGFNNEEIAVLKFRTMRHEAADARAERQVSENDERITRLGRMLRKTSLDELPQLFNVLAGEMSLVGPRPHAVGMKTGDVESARLVAEYAHRHRIKPGMTGWAAINGSRGPLHHPAEVSRRVALDVDYIDRQSLWLDLRIMLLTLPGILGDRRSLR